MLIQGWGRCNRRLFCDRSGKWALTHRIDVSDDDSLSSRRGSGSH